jgi:F-type H+-transporting ATPase subunit b
MRLNATLIFEVISFLILVVILGKYAYQPLLKFLDERSKSIKENLDEAEKKRSEAERILAQSQKELDEAKKQALTIKEEAKRQSEESREIILREAEETASSIIAQSRKAILKEIEQAKIKLKAFIADTSVTIASKILKREIKEKDHESLLKDSLEGLKRYER